MNTPPESIVFTTRLRRFSDKTSRDFLTVGIAIGVAVGSILASVFWAWLTWNARP